MTLNADDNRKTVTVRGLIVGIYVKEEIFDSDVVPSVNKVFGQGPQIDDNFVVTDSCQKTDKVINVDDVVIVKLKKDVEISD